MSDDSTRLARWTTRSRPRPGELARALAAAGAGSLSATALSVGALGLLVASAARPGLRAVGAALVVIELLAFTRSPLRYAERLSAHRLGFAAVTQWRRWLTATVAHRDHADVREMARGDLLERALSDTEQLQDLWLRALIPGAGALSVAVASVVTLGLLPGGWGAVAAGLAVVDVAALGALVLAFAPACRRDRAVRAARGRYRASLVELAACGPELALLGAADVVVRRDADARAQLASAERAQRRLRTTLELLAPAAALAAVAVVALARPSSAPLWSVVAALLAAGTLELVATATEGLDALVGTVAAAERLEELEGPARAGRAPAPASPVLRLTQVGVAEGWRHLARDVTLRVAPGRRVALVGASGSGKSALLRVAAGLDRPSEGAVSLDDVDLREIDETALRARLAYVGPEPGLARGRLLDVVTLGRTLGRDPLADLAALGMSRGADERLEGLSRGERVRLAVARALAVAPEVVVLDEPTAALGPAETHAVLSLLSATRAAVLVATHDPAVVDWADEVVELSGGRVAPVSR